MGVLAALVLGGVFFAPPTPEDVRAAARRVYEGSRWQKDLPPVAGEEKPTDTSASGEGADEGDDPSSRDGSDPSASGRGRTERKRRPPPRPTAEGEPADIGDRSNVS